jgi:hypothetical protein
MKRSKATDQAFPPYLAADEQRKNDDFEWALHDLELRQKYGGKIVAVHRKRVLGVGKTYQAAWAAAQRRRNCPAKKDVAMVVVPGRRHFVSGPKVRGEPSCHWKYRPILCLSASTNTARFGSVTLK